MSLNRLFRRPVLSLLLIFGLVVIAWMVTYSVSSDRQTPRHEQAYQLSAEQREYVVETAWKLLSPEDKANVCLGVAHDGPQWAAEQISGANAPPVEVEALVDLLRKECP